MELKRSFLKRLILGRVFSSLADNMLLFIVPLIIYRESNSAMLSGLIFTIEWIPRVFAFPFVGILADKISYQKTYLFGDLLRSVIVGLSFCLAMFFTSHLFLVFCILVIASGMLQSMSSLSVESLIAEQVIPEEMPEAQSKMQTVEQASVFCGPLLGGFFITYFDRIELLLFISLCFFMSSLVAMTFRYSGLVKKPSIVNKPKGIIDNLKAGFSEIRQSPELIELLVLGFNANLILGSLTALGPALVTGSFGMSDQHFSALMVATGVTSILTLLVVPHLFARFSRNLTTKVAYSIAMIGSLLVPFIGNYFMYVGVAMCMVAGIMIFNISSRSERARIIPIERYGTVIGCFAFILQISLPLSGALVTILAKRFSPQENIMLLSLSAVFINVCLIASQRKRNGSVRQNIGRDR